MSFDFDGINDEITCTSDAALDNLSAFTLVAWINPDGYGENNRGRIFDKSDATALTKGWILNANNVATNAVVLTVAWNNGANNVSARLSSAYTTGTWGAIAASYNGGSAGSSVKMYKGFSGTDQSSDHISGSGTRGDDSAETLRIGNSPGGDRTWDGRLAHLQIFNRVLSSAEIVQAMRRPGSVRNGLLTYYPLMNDVYDYGTTELDGLNNGATLSESAPAILPSWHDNSSTWHGTLAASSPAPPELPYWVAYSDPNRFAAAVAEIVPDPPFWVDRNTNIHAALAATTTPSGFVRIKGFGTFHGNAAKLCWYGNDAVLLPNQEGQTSVIRYNVTNPSAISIDWILSAGNYTECVSASPTTGEAYVKYSHGWEIRRFNPETGNTIWTHNHADGEVVAHTEDYVFVPKENNTPGQVLTLDPATGNILHTWSDTQGWFEKVTSRAEIVGSRLYVGYVGTVSRGIILFNIETNGSLTELHRITSGVSEGDFSVHGNYMWAFYSPAVPSAQRLRRWDWTNPTNPIPGPEVPAHDNPSALPVNFWSRFGSMDISPDGQRLAIVARYSKYDSVSGNWLQAQDYPRRLYWYDVSGETPVILSSYTDQVGGYYVNPDFVRISPDGDKFAFSVRNFGVYFGTISGDVLTVTAKAATAGENADTYVSSDRRYYTNFAKETIQVFDSQIGGSIGGYYNPAQIFQGRWQSYDDSATTPIIAAPRKNGGGATFFRPKTASQELSRDGVCSDNAGKLWWGIRFNAAKTRVYAATDGGVKAFKLGAKSGSTYPTTRLGDADTASIFKDVEVVGTDLWALRSYNKKVAGVKCYDISGVDTEEPSPAITLPTLMTLNFEASDSLLTDLYQMEHGNMVNICSARGMVYVGAGRKGIRIFDASARVEVNALFEYQVTITSILTDGDYLYFTHYWQPDDPLPKPYKEGIYVMDIRNSPDSPSLVDWFPQPGGTSMWMHRLMNGYVYPVSLYGVDELQFTAGAAPSAPPLWVPNHRGLDWAQAGVVTPTPQWAYRGALHGDAMAEATIISAEDSGSSGRSYLRMNR